MRERYVQHFLHNVIELSDALGIYYAQDCFCDRSAFFGVELKTFFDHRQTVQWLRDCIAYDRCGIYNLRGFLVQSAPRRYMVHRMDNHRVMDEVARVIVDYDYPVVVRPWHEPPWSASNTIDVIYAIRNGAPLSVMSRSPELSNAAKMLTTAAQKNKQGTAQSFQQNLLALNDFDPNDVDTARSPWDVEQWKQGHQLRLAARPEALLPHSPKGWGDPDAAKKVIVNVIKILALTTRQILRHPIDSLIIEPVKEFAGMFQPPKADPHRDQARHDVLGNYYQSKDIDPNELDTADHPNRPMQWAHSHDKRHQKDRNPARMQMPSPEDTEKILAMLVTYLIARKYGKAVRSGSEALAEESVQAVITPSKSGAANKGVPEVESPNALEKLENKEKKKYSASEKADGPETTAKKYKNKPPTKKHIDLAKKPGKSAEQIAARKRVASHFYEKQGYDPDTIPAHLEGVDLNKPVEVVKLKEGTKLKQLQIPGAPQGNYYTTPDTPADKLGISLKVRHKETGEIIERIEGGYIVKQDTEALSSTTADILDNWSIPGENMVAKGGGKQYFSTDKVSIGSMD